MSSSIINHQSTINNPIRVLIVDDSPTARAYLAHIIDSDPGLRVIGTACNGEEALDFLKHEKPDVITMDINMPVMNGLEATRRIMEEAPMPIIIVTASWDVKEVRTSFLAIEAGALTALKRPEGLASPNHEKEIKELINTIKVMSEVKVVKRWPKKAERSSPEKKEPVPSRPSARSIKVVAIGASTGGPMVIHMILSRLPRSFSAPILIVQHMAPGFVAGFADWLDKGCDLSVRVASDSDYMQAGYAYIAPDDFHLGVKKNGQLILSRDAPENSLRPSVSYLFRSAAQSFTENALGIILTGMGKDGASELKLLHDKGAVTIAQDKNSAIVFGMPGEAVNLGAAAYVLPPERIAEMLVQITEGDG